MTHIFKRTRKPKGFCSHKRYWKCELHGEIIANYYHTAKQMNERYADWPFIASYKL